MSDKFKDIAVKIYEAVDSDKRVDKVLITITHYIREIAEAYMEEFQPDSYAILEEAKKVKTEYQIIAKQTRKDNFEQQEKNRALEYKIDEVAEIRAKEMVKDLLQSFIDGTVETW